MDKGSNPDSRLEQCTAQRNSPKPATSEQTPAERFSLLRFHADPKPSSADYKDPANPQSKAPD